MSSRMLLFGPLGNSMVLGALCLVAGYGLGSVVLGQRTPVLAVQPASLINVSVPVLATESEKNQDRLTPSPEMILPVMQDLGKIIDCETTGVGCVDMDEDYAADPNDISADADKLPVEDPVSPKVQGVDPSVLLFISIPGLAIG